jgi:DNA-binding PadR family transcriptional regulator
VSVRFLVLALLAQQPRYGYEIRRWLTDSHADMWTNVKPYSVHHALSQLEREGFARLVRVEAVGKRDRSVYEITDSGRSELNRIARALWASPAHTYPRDLYLLITFGDVLPKETVHELAVELAATIRAELAEWERGSAAKSPMPPLWWAMFDNGKAHLAANLELVEHVIAYTK